MIENRSYSHAGDYIWKLQKIKRGRNMTIQEFYNYCKEKKLLDHELLINWYEISKKKWQDRPIEIEDIEYGNDGAPYVLLTQP